EQRALGREMQLGEPQRVEAPILGRVHLRPRLVEALGMRALSQRRKLVKHAEFHAVRPRRVASAYRAGNAAPPQCGCSKCLARGVASSRPAVPAFAAAAKPLLRCEIGRDLIDLPRGQALGSLVHDLVRPRIRREGFELPLEVAAMLPGEAGYGAGALGLVAMTRHAGRDI